MKHTGKNIISVLLTLAICLGLMPVALATETDTQDEVTPSTVYLSDINYQSASVGYDKIHLNGNMSDQTISLKVDGNQLYFDKGITAHATSTIVYNLQDYADYNYFTSYIGIDYSQGSKGNVIFHIYTSTDGKSWNEEYVSNELTASSESEFVTIDISNVSYLKLYADKNGGNGNDHAVYADAKLSLAVTNPDIADTGLKTLEEYDNILKEMKGSSTDYTSLLNDEEFEHILLQRKFVQDAGYKTLSLLCERDEKYSDIITFLLNDYKALKLYVLGGKPNGSYQKSMDVLYDLYNSHWDDVNDTTYGDLYERMIIALSLTHSTTVYAWQDSARVSDPVKRYEIYKDLHSRGLLWDNVFENLTVDEMRWVMFANIDDDEIEALNTYVRENNNLTEFTYEKWCGINGYNYITYDLNYSYPEHPSIFDIFEQGAVCGGISKSSVNIRQVFGVPGATSYQPGHCAWLDFRYLNNDGKDSVCYIGNNVSGWTQTHREFDDRMPCGWGNASWRNSGGYCASYVLLSQDALNDYDNYCIAEELVYMSYVFTDEAEAICRQALKIESFNLDAFENLIYATEGCSQEKSLALLQEIADNMYGYPLPMNDLINLLKSKHSLNSDTAIAETMLMTYSALEKGTTITSENSLQPDACKTMANNIISKNSYALATFSFVGEDANVLKLTEQFSENAKMEYSLNSGDSWTQAGGTSVTLSNEEIEVINSNNDIRVRLEGMESYYTIDITKASAPTGLYNNDLENKIMGTTDDMEWSFDKESWTTFGEETPDLTGNKTIYVRTAGSETAFASDAIALDFTADSTDLSKSYITIDRLSLEGFSSEASAHSQYAKNSLDGNINTIWHSNWTWYSDNDRYIIIGLDKETYLSSLDYVPSQDGANGRILSCQVYTSLDGESWDLAGTATGWGNNTETKTLTFDTPVYTKYVKIVGTSTVNSFISASMFNLYEDLTIEDTEEYLYGDTNLDGEINVKDATRIQKYLVNLLTLSDTEKISADVNGDDDIDIMDAVLIQKHLINGTDFPSGTTFTAKKQN